MPEANRFVQKRSAEDIAILADLIREGLQLGQDRIAMAPFLEFVMPELMPDFELQIVADDDLQGIEGLTDLSEPIIRMPDQVYKDLCAGVCRARFTAAHELGHLLMHSNNHVHYALAEYTDEQMDPEWQANMFAAVFLMPEAAFRQTKTKQEAMARFGVGYYAVGKRARFLKHKLKEEK